MSMKKCDAGLHFYDSSKHASCPYCASQGQSAGAPGGVDETVALNNPGVDSGATETIGLGHTAATAGYSSSGGTTEAVYRKRGNDDEPDTIALVKTKMKLEPVVGWLVGLNDADKGKDLRVKPGLNFVGRKDHMDLVVNKDDRHISREDHAELEFDPNDNAFYLIRKTNAETYVNGEKIRQPIRLNAYDVLRFGTTDYVFVPLCGEQFSWKEED